VDSQLEDKTFCTERQQALPDFSQLLIYEFRTQKYLRKMADCISNASQFIDTFVRTLFVPQNSAAIGA
jgi:hypothetical protein